MEDRTSLAVKAVSLMQTESSLDPDTHAPASALQGVSLKILTADVQAASSSQDFVIEHSDIMVACVSCLQVICVLLRPCLAQPQMEKPKSDLNCVV